MIARQATGALQANKQPKPSPLHVRYILSSSKPRPCTLSQDILATDVTPYLRSQALKRIIKTLFVSYNRNAHADSSKIVLATHLSISRKRLEYPEMWVKGVGSTTRATLRGGVDFRFGVFRPCPSCNHVPTVGEKIECETIRQR